MKSSEVLRNAANLIAKKGWCQGAYQNKEGCVCVAGAFNKVVSHNEAIQPYYSARAALRREIGGAPLISWNDTPGRTMTEVLEALNTAAARQEAQGL